MLFWRFHTQPPEGPTQPAGSRREDDNDYRQNDDCSLNGSTWMSVDCLIIFTCVNTLVVHRKSSGCSEFADCVKIRQGATCRCRPGFVGNGLTCAFLRDQVAPHAPRDNYATVITPAVTAGWLVTTVAVNMKRRPTYSDWRNQRRQPLRNRPWRHQNRDNPNTINRRNKIWRPAKKVPMLHANKPGRHPSPAHSDSSHRFPKSDRDPMVPDIGDPKLAKNRRRFENVPRHPMANRKRLSKPRNRQRTDPNVFTHLNKPNRGKKVVKPLTTDRRHFIGNREHPITLDKTRIMPDTEPGNKLRLYPAHPNKPGQIYMSCTLKNGKKICKLIRGIYKNGKTAPSADLLNVNPSLAKRLIIFLNNKFRPHKKHRTNPVNSPNNRNQIIDDSVPRHGQRHPRRRLEPGHVPHKGTGNNTHNYKNPTSQTLSNPKRNDSRPNRPIAKDHKTPHLNQHRHKQPGPSDIKRVTEILRRVSVALNETGKKRVTASRWVILPRSSTLSTSPGTRKYTFTNLAATFTPPTTSFVNPTSKTTGGGRFSRPPFTSTSRIGTPAEYTYSLEQPQLGTNRRPLSNNDGGVPGARGGVVKNNPRQHPRDNVGHKYPTADGTIDGFVIDRPPEWPFRYPVAHHGYGSQNRPKDIQQPNNEPGVNPIIRKCGAAGCGKRKNVTNKGQTFLPRKYVGFVYPSSTGSSSLGDSVSTLATTVLDVIPQATIPEIKTNPVKGNRTVNSNPQQPKTNPEATNKNVEPRPPSIEKVHVISENCKQTKEINPLSGLRYNLLKEIRQSVEQIEG